jgi:hypothetical protein
MCILAGIRAERQGSVDRSIVADLDRLAVVMSRQKPAWEPGTRQAYHALTLGFYEGELLRRVDPQHRTLGQFFQDEIASQIGEDVYLRLPEAIPNSRLATLSPPTLIEMLRGFGLRFMFEAMNPRSNIYRALSVNPGTRIYQDAQRVYARDLEVPSGNGVGTARAIAHAYGVFATDGRELGLRRETLDLLAAPAVPPTHGFHDECLKADGVQFSLGFMKSSAVWPFGSTTSFGAPGAGGSLGFADPEAGVGYAYVTSRMGTRLTGDPRDVALRNALYSVLSVPSCASHMEMRPAPQEVAGGVEEFGEGDSLLDTFMPEYDVRERHNIQIHAPASIVLDCASRMDLHQSRAVQAIFRAREFLLGSKPHPIPEGGLLQFTKSIGWRTLAEEPGHEIVMGAITQPWSADVIFKPVFPEEFATLREPDHVKIAWTLRADAVTGDICIFRTETRAVACDESARKKFRRYWRRFRPGIALIRRLMLKPLKREAERQAQRFPQKRTAFP